MKAAQLERELEGRERASLHEALNGGGNVWLAAIPLDDSGLALDRQTFRDAVALRMGQPIPDKLPSYCPSCGEEDIELSHFLKCPNGGWVRRRHTEVLKVWAKLMRGVCETVVEEPFLGPVVGGPFLKDTTTTDPEARADILARGFFQPQRNSLFDVVITDTAKQSALKKRMSPEAVLREAERGKDDEYSERVVRKGDTFTPLAASVYGTLAPRAEQVLQRLAGLLAKRKEERGVIEHCARLKIQSAIVKATSLCLRARCLNHLPDTAAAGTEEEAGTKADGSEGEEEVEEDLAGQWANLHAPAFPAVVA